MITLCLLFTGFMIGLWFGIFGVIIYQDCMDSEHQIKETEQRIKQLNERIENEKRKFYRDFPIGKKRD